MLILSKLVIVGKQSAGKSSLLQSLTEVPFPVGGKLCTRFATRIVSRHTNPGTPQAIHVSIESGDVDPFRYQEVAGQTDDFNCPVAYPLTAKVFEDIIEQVCRSPDFVALEGSWVAR
jgi:GTPase SAR1 family protein